MSTALSTTWRVHRHAPDVECTVLDSPAGPQFAIGWSPDDATVLDAATDARAAVARGRRVREALMRDGLADVL